MKSAPLITNEFRFCGFTIPHSMAMALAVRRLSPVTIRTLTPAVLHWAMAPGTSCRRMSFIPRRAIMVRSWVSTLKTPRSSLSLKSEGWRESRGRVTFGFNFFLGDYYSTEGLVGHHFDCGLNLAS